MHNEPSVSVSRDRHFGGPKKSVTIYRNRRSHLTEMTGHALPKSAVTIGRNTHSAVNVKGLDTDFDKNGDGSGTSCADPAEDATNVALRLRSD